MRPRRRVTALLSALLLGTLVVSPVHANGGRYGWSSCNWENSYSLQSGTVFVRAPGYPADGWGDGVLNSFRNRITQAIATWNAALDGAGYILPAEISRMADTGYGEQILVQQAELGSYVWGDATTYSQSGTNACVMHSTVNDRMVHASIRTDIHPNWWTQEDTRRSYWEGCPSRGYLPAYTCSKDRDFEGLLAHELGHALGIPHPEAVDAHQPSITPDSASTAECSSLTTRATMCAYLVRWRSSGQTLHVWDRESFRQIEVRH